MLLIITCALLILTITLPAELEIFLQAYLPEVILQQGRLILILRMIFSNLGADITTIANELNSNNANPQEEKEFTSGNITIAAGDDINIATLEERNRTELFWGTRKKAEVK